MMRYAIALLTALALSTACMAQVLNAVADRRRAPEPAEPRETRLSARPAAEPIPTLKYQLLPTFLEKTPTDAAQTYYQVLTGLTLDDAEKKQIGAWMDLPLKDLPRKNVHELLDKHEYWLRQLDRAARCERCDWRYPLREEGYSMLLPELSKLRDLSKLLFVRARLRIAEGDVEGAVQALQSGLAMGRHVAEAPVLISALVGSGTAGKMLQQVEQLIQEPNSPNLYWALTALPRPMVDMRKPIEVEMGFAEMQWPFLAGVARGGRIDPAQWQKLLNELPRHGATQGTVAIMMVHHYAKGKQFLIAQGRKPDEVEKMPVREVVSIYAVHTYQRLRDDLFKWHYVPYWQAQRGFEQAETALRKDKQSMEAWPLVTLLPALGRVRFQEARLDRHIAALRCIEAVRLYAAAHDGKPPAKLEDIKAVPIPVNPVTGKPFGYKVDGQTVTLDAPALEGMSPSDSGRYILTLTK